MSRNKRNIILIGFMGSGKTTLGIRLSYRLRRPLLDTDRWIEKEQGMSVSDIFASYGEEGFRQLETQAVKSLLEADPGQVISTGGGLPMREENQALLKQLGFVVFLRIRPETVCERLKGDTTRPLLQKPDPVRNPIYEQAADRVVDVDGKDFEELLEEILDGTDIQPEGRLK